MCARERFVLLDAVVYYRGAWNGIEQCSLCQGASGVGSVGALGSTMVIGVAGRRTAGGCDGGCVISSLFLV